MKPTNAENGNRRDYYRITDLAHLQITALEPLENTVPENDGLGKAIPDFEHARLLSQELAWIERDLARVLASTNERSDPLVTALRLMNRKIDALGRAAIASRSELEALPTYEISLSQSGLALVTDKAWAADTVVCIRLMLLPNALSLSMEAVVIDSHSINEGYLTRFNFCDTNGEQADLLSRHILKAQQQQLREKP